MKTFVDEALSAARALVSPRASEESKRRILAAICFTRSQHAEPLALARELADGVRALRLAVENRAMLRNDRPKPRRGGLLAAVDRINARNGHGLRK